MQCESRRPETIDACMRRFAHVSEMAVAGSIKSTRASECLPRQTLAGERKEGRHASLRRFNCRAFERHQTSSSRGRGRRRSRCVAPAGTPAPGPMHPGRWAICQALRINDDLSATRPEITFIRVKPLVRSPREEVGVRVRALDFLRHNYAAPPGLPAKSGALVPTAGSPPLAGVERVADEPRVIFH